MTYFIYTRIGLEEKLYSKIQMEHKYKDDVKAIPLCFKKRFTTVSNVSHIIVWKKAIDDYGRIYYWNSITRETVWNLYGPPKIPFFKDMIHANSLFINCKKNQINELQIETIKR